MSKHKTDKSFHEVQTVLGVVKGEFSVRDACKLMFYAACSWLVSKGLYLILFAVAVYLLKAPTISLIGAGMHDSIRIIRIILGNKSG